MAVKKRVSGNTFGLLADLYARMEAAYNASAGAAGLSCTGCETNCCVSYFQHHTYVEWIYLHKGIRLLAPVAREALLSRARAYLERVAECLARNDLPDAMCPVNENGRCTLYTHRLMICRMHGTRNIMHLPDGREEVFPGCARYVGLCGKAGDNALPALDRTPLYRELAALEADIRKRAGAPLPRVNMTIAEMIVAGAPVLRAD